MDTKTLQQANEINREIDIITYFMENLDTKDASYVSATIFTSLPKDLKDQLRPILEAYQEKLFNQLKNL